MEQNRNVLVNRDWLINYGYTVDETQGDENRLANIIHPDNFPHITVHHDHLKNTADEKKHSRSGISHQ